MDITQLFVSQRKLRRAGQVPGLVRAIRDGEPIRPIRLSEAADGTVQVDDGHHRAVAYWLAGRSRLGRPEYTLVQTDRPRPRRGCLADLVAREASRLQAAVGEEGPVTSPAGAQRSSPPAPGRT
jgi:hypothetical protein